MSLAKSISGVFTIAEMEARKIRHDSTELWMRSVQPALWLLIFGEVLSAVKGLAPPDTRTSSTSPRACWRSPCSSWRSSTA